MTTAKDLTGKTIAVQALRDFSELALHAWVDQHGGDWSTLKIVEVPQAAILGALSDGRSVGEVDGGADTPVVVTVRIVEHLSHQPLCTGPFNL